MGGDGRPGSLRNVWSGLGLGGGGVFRQNPLTLYGSSATMTFFTPNEGEALPCIARRAWVVPFSTYNNPPGGRRALRGDCPGKRPHRGRRSLRPPRQSVEPENAAVHLRQAQLNPHHRFA